MTALACDFGGRRIKLGIVEHGRVAQRQVISSQADRPLLERLPAVAHELRQLCQRAGVVPAHCTGVAIAFPSIIDPESGAILDHFGKYADTPPRIFCDWAEAEFDLPAVVDNDARMAAIGEWQAGAGRGCDNVVMMTLGTGIGSAAFIRGAPLYGRHGQAGILGGHMTVDVQGRPCVCGNQGCAEAEASTSVLAELAPATTLAGAGDDALPALQSYQQVFASGVDAAPYAPMRDRALAVWSAAAVNLIHAYDPEVLILGGGVMGSGDVILPAVAAAVTAHAHTPWGQVRVAASQLGDDAALVAAEWRLARRFAGDG